MASELRLPETNMPFSEADREGGLRLDRFLSSLRRHILLIIGVTIATASMAALKAVIDEPVYQSTVELLTPQSTLETEIISTLNPDTLSSQTDVVDISLDETQLKILTSPRILEPVLEQLQISYPNITYRDLVRNLTVTSGNEEGGTLVVEYKSDDSEQVTEVLETVAAAYLEYSLEDRQSDIDRGIEFVDEQLPMVRSRVDRLDAELESLRQSSNLIDPLITGEQLTAQLAKFTTEQLDVRVQIERAQKLYQNLQQEIVEGEEMATNSALLENERYQSLLNQLLEIDSQLAEELTLYLEDSPEVQVTEDFRNNIQPLLEREALRAQEQLANSILELQDQDQALSDIIQVLNQNNESLSTVTRQYNDIQRELDIATENLNQFLTKREALRIDAVQRQTPWEILVPPDTPRKIAASIWTNLALGGLLGLLLGSGTAIVIDRVRGNVHTIKELREAAPVPLLGKIPYSLLLDNGPLPALTESQMATAKLELSTRSSTLPGDKLPGPFLESFSSLATSIRLSRPDSPIQSLTVSSASPNAGKSTISFHLAYAFASMGQRTLLVDADLRRPSLHKLCNISNTKGLTNYAAGDVSRDDVLIKLPPDENLFLLPAGPKPPNPLKILTSRRLEELLDFVHQDFDMVIFDTPPLLGLADSLMISRKSQGLLLVAYLGRVKFSELQSALDELSIAKVPVVGMVANGAKEEENSYYSYGDDYDQSSSAALAGEAGSSLNGSLGSQSWYKNLMSPITKHRGGKR